MFWVLAPRNAASVVFTQFTDSGGWSSMGLALMVGQISAIYACICSDAAAHMSEEIKVCSTCYYIPKHRSFADFLCQDAGRTVPTAMVGSYLLSGVLSVIFLISYLFVIVDIEGAVDHPTGYPFLFVFTQAFSMEAVNALTSIVICLIFAGTLSYNLSSSRQVWAVSFVHGIDDRPMLTVSSSLAMKVCRSLAGFRRLIPHLKSRATLFY
jgi:choline transport protein